MNPPRLDGTLGLLRMMIRGALWRCPHCGRGAIFGAGMRLVTACEHCGFEVDRRATDTWAFIYLSTAALTGVVVIGMLLFRPDDLFYGRMMLVGAAVAIVVCSLPSRKGMAIAFDYFIELHSVDHE